MVPPKLDAQVPHQAHRERQLSQDTANAAFWARQRYPLPCNGGSSVRPYRLRFRAPHRRPTVHRTPSLTEPPPSNRPSGVHSSCCFDRVRTNRRLSDKASQEYSSPSTVSRFSRNRYVAVILPTIGGAVNIQLWRVKSWQT